MAFLNCRFGAPSIQIFQLYRRGEPNCFSIIFHHIDSIVPMTPILTFPLRSDLSSLGAACIFPLMEQRISAAQRANPRTFGDKVWYQLKTTGWLFRQPVFLGLMAISGITGIAIAQLARLLF